MPKSHRPRRGSMQFWPRKRAKRAYARVRSFPNLTENKLLGFIGYKAGMTHVMAKDNTTNSITKNQTIAMPVTIIECPPIKPLSIRFYKNDDNALKLVSEIFTKKSVKKVKVSKKQTKEPENFDDVTLVIYSQPNLTGIGKKSPDLLELGISGTKEQKLELAKKLLEQNEIKLEDIFQENQFCDIHGVTKGKGFQGTVKRYGVTTRQHKSEKVKRGIGNLGSWTPKRVSYRVPQAGRMGYHQRIDYNKQVLKIGADPKEINPKGGLMHYGIIKNPYLLVKGSVPGPAKRAMVLTYPRRPKEKIHNLEITAISVASKQ